jgi:hypothetical protein
MHLIESESDLSLVGLVWAKFSASTDTLGRNVSTENMREPEHIVRSRHRHRSTCFTLLYTILRLTRHQRLSLEPQFIFIHLQLAGLSLSSGVMLLSTYKPVQTRKRTAFLYSDLNCRRIIVTLRFLTFSRSSLVCTYSKVIIRASHFPHLSHPVPSPNCHTNCRCAPGFQYNLVNP